MNKDSLLEILSQKSSYISRTLRIIGISEDDIEDLRNDILENALRKITTLKDVDSIDAWLRTITMHKASKYMRKRSQNKELSNILKNESGEEIDLYDLVADEKTTEHLFQEAERRKAAAMLLDTLAEPGKQIIQLRFWGDYKFTEIAMILNINQNTVKTIYRRSLQKLQQNYYLLFGEEGISD